MAKFITLTDAQDGTRRRINANSIAQYFASGYTMVLSESGSFDAIETPEQIDAMLAVTDSALSLLAELVDGMPDVEDSKTRVLERSRKLIAAARGE